MAGSGLMFCARYGMPFAPQPRPRLSASSPARRAVIAVRRESPGSERQVCRALQFGRTSTRRCSSMTTSRLRDALAGVAGIDAERTVRLIDPDVLDHQGGSGGWVLRQVAAMLEAFDPEGGAV